MIKLNIKQYITEHIREEFSRRQDPKVARYLEIAESLASQVAANNVGVQNVYEEFKQIQPLIDKIKEKELILDDGIRQIKHILYQTTEFKDMIRKARKEYFDYLDRLEKDISTYKESDQAVRRLAALEGRITILEEILK